LSLYLYKGRFTPTRFILLPTALLKNIPDDYRLILEESIRKNALWRQWIDQRVLQKLSFNGFRWKGCNVEQNVKKDLTKKISENRLWASLQSIEPT